MGGKVIREAVNDQAEREGSRRHGRMTFEGEFGMGKEAVPEVGREFGVGGCESGDEVGIGRPH